MQKNQLITQVRKVKTAEELAEEELKQEKAQVDEQLESYLYRIHGQFINETDFCGPEASDEERKAAY